MRFLDKLRPLGLLLLRWALGIIFIYHGFPKLFRPAAGTFEFFQHLGFPTYFAYVAGMVEFFGGCLLVVGLFTRLAGVLLAGQMLVAIWTAHLGKGILAVGEYEFPMALAAAAFLLATSGAGVLSLDYAIFRQKS
jgi:putative oxidoreductase